MATIITGHPKGSSSNSPRQTCTSEACINRAHYISLLMDQRVDPCEDFYRFTCGNFLRYVEVPKGEKMWSTITWMMEYTESRMVGLMSEEPQADEPQAYHHVKTLYRLCMDEAALDKRGVAPLLELLVAAGGWPVLGNWNSENWSLLDTELLLWEFGLNMKSFINVQTSIGHSEELEVRAPWVINDDTVLAGEGKPEVQNQYEYMVEVAVLLGADRQTAEQQMLELLYFEKDLIQFQKENHNSSKMDVKTLSEDIPWINWLKLLNHVFGKVLTIKQNTTVHVHDLSYFRGLESFLKGYPTEVAANYLLWGAVREMADILTSKLRSLKERKPRSKECLKIVEHRLLVAVASMFVKSFNETKIQVENMTEILRQEMMRNIMHAEWLDEEARTLSMRKILNLKKEVAYPEQVTNKTILDFIFNSLSMDENQFFEAMLDILKWGKDLNAKVMIMNFEQFEWLMFASELRDVNAYNMGTSIAIPAGIINNPFFDAGVPGYANYGALGVIIGHEIVHSFDSSGFNFVEGELVEFGNKTMGIFHEKTQCIVDQYSNFTDSRTHLSIFGENTQRENIADNGGFKIAYRAYKRLMGEREEPRLPGLEQFSNEQMFMISYASSWCTKHDTEELIKRIHRDSHSPGEFRVKGVAMNSPEFSRAFHCKKGDPMNPEKKCVVW